MARVTNLKGIPRAPRPLRGRGRLPSVENLQRKTPEDLIRTLRRFGLEPDIKALEKRAHRAFERLDDLLDKGQIPDAATWESIDKQVEREVAQYLRQQVKAAIRNYRLHRAETAAEHFIWITVGDTNVCPSCEPRHGKSKTIPQWRALGLPGDAVLVCGRECRCSLQPDSEE